jgi:hypothetical protein
MQQIGVRVPKTVVYDPKTSKPLNTLDSALEFPTNTYLIKPEYGDKGKGILRSIDRQELPSAIGRLESLSLIQEEVPIEKEFRYQIYQDKDGRIWRIRYEKTIPAIKADGKRSIREIITDLSWGQQKTILACYGKYLDSIPERDSYIRTGLTGNLARGALVLDINQATGEVLDTLIMELWDRLKSHIGTPLNYLTLDFGVCDQPDKSTLLSDLVFFEHQAFAGISIYQKSKQNQAVYLRFQTHYLRDTLSRLE